METMPKAGMTGQWETTVDEGMLAAAVGSGEVRVLATPVMIMGMERAAMEAVRSCLPEGVTSVGTRVEVSHMAPTPCGMKVRFAARLTAPSGKASMSAWWWTGKDSRAVPRPVAVGASTQAARPGRSAAKRTRLYGQEGQKLLPVLVPGRSSGKAFVPLGGTGVPFRRRSPVFPYGARKRSGPVLPSATAGVPVHETGPADGKGLARPPGEG